MKHLLYITQHNSYTRKMPEDQPIVDVISYPQGKEWKQTIKRNTIFFVYCGTLTISYDTYINQTIPEGRGFTLPIGCHYTASADLNVTLIRFELDEEVLLCEKMPIKNLPSTKQQKNPKQLVVLEINKQLYTFQNNIIDSFMEGVLCKSYYKLKRQELLYLLHFYYSKEVLSDFFYSFRVNRNTSFTNFVLKNYLKVKTVQELASLSKYSLSGFEKEFKKTFGMTAYKWMTIKRVKRLYHNIHATEKSFKQIVKEMEFTSLSQLNDYCKKHFGLPPGKMRSQKTTPSCVEAC